MSMTIIFCILLLATLFAWHGSARITLCFYMLGLALSIISFVHAMDSAIKISL